MKRFFAVLVAVLFVVGVPVLAFSEPPTIVPPGSYGLPNYYQATVSVHGVPGKTVTFTVDNTARTMQALYEGAGGTWIQAGVAPFEFLLTCENQDIRIAFGGATASATLGHRFASDGSWLQPGRHWMSSASLRSVTDSASVCQFTPGY
jgi:hypothetical protein